MFKETAVRGSEFLQLILLDNLYAQSGTERVIFQGGTALRWVYGGVRFSEGLDFVTHLSNERIKKKLSSVFRATATACVAQFGPGQTEYKIKERRKGALQALFVMRPEGRRQRTAVRMEFERLRTGSTPEFRRNVLRDLPPVAALISSGTLIMPYSSSIIVAETLDELLTDKIRALYERPYLKGRDIFDVWWIVHQLKISPDLTKLKDKLLMYQAPFIPVREADYFLKDASQPAITDAMISDLPRFLPHNIFSKYLEEDFKDIVNTLKFMTSTLIKQGMQKAFD